MIVSNKHLIAYWPVPKNACTSLKEAFYRIEHGSPYVPNEGRHIHNLYPSLPNGGRYHDWLDDTYYKFVVIRDPIERFVSAFKNRVLHHGELGAVVMDSSARKACLTDINEFVRLFEFFLKNSKSIHHHCQPQVRFVRNVLTRADAVVDIKQIKDLEGRLSARCGEFYLERKQTSPLGRNKCNTELTRSSLDKLKDYYANDYRQLGPYLV